MKKLPTVDIKGSAYTLVKDRVLYFNEAHPNGSIAVRLISPYDSDLIVMRATVTPDVEKPARSFVDYSQERVGDGFINKSSAMENCSTSAIGRALALLGIGIVDSIASVDEMTKAENQNKTGAKKATEKQIAWMLDEADKRGLDYEGLTKLLTIKPEDVPVWKVKAAIELIQKQSSPKLEDPVSVELDEEQTKKLEEGTLLDNVDY